MQPEDCSSDLCKAASHMMIVVSNFAVEVREPRHEICLADTTGALTPSASFPLVVYWPPTLLQESARAHNLTLKVN
jgi:hypothetical protein